MDSPPIWSDNIVRNFERLIEWLDAIIVMCDISPLNYSHYMARTCKHIQSDDIENVIKELGSNFSMLPEWITKGAMCINKNARLPDSCIISTFDVLQFENQWKIHVCSERQILDDFNRVCNEMRKDVQNKMKLFYEEESDEYSSYSDYSEETTSSEEEEAHKEDYEEDYEEDDDEEEDEEEDETDREERKEAEKDNLKKKGGTRDKFFKNKSIVIYDYHLGF